MAELPNPEWLTLPETLEFLSRHGIPEEKAKEALLRAFRDAIIGTRGRFEPNPFEHEPLNELSSANWDRAEVDWEGSSFRRPTPRTFKDPFWSYHDVDVCRQHLESWLQRGAQQSETLGTAKNAGGRPPKYDWDAFWTEIVVKADLDGLPERSELTEEMKDWCSENWGEEPADSYIRNKIRLIYEHPRKGGGRQ